MQPPAVVLLKSYSLNKRQHPLKVQSVSLKLMLSDLLGAESLCNHQFNSLALKGARECCKQLAGFVLTRQETKGNVSNSLYTHAPCLWQDLCSFLYISSICATLYRA